MTLGLSRPVPVRQQIVRVNQVDPQPPRQRLLTARLREAGGALGVIGELLEDLRDGRKQLFDPGADAELDSSRRAASRYLERCPQKGRIP